MDDDDNNKKPIPFRKPWFKIEQTATGHTYAKQMLKGEFASGSFCSAPHLLTVGCVTNLRTAISKGLGVKRVNKMRGRSK